MFTVVLEINNTDDLMMKFIEVSCLLAMGHYTLVGDTFLKSNQSNTYQIKHKWFLRRGENWSTQRKTCEGRVENQQTQPT